MKSSKIYRVPLVRSHFAICTPGVDFVSWVTNVYIIISTNHSYPTKKFLYRNAFF